MTTTAKWWLIHSPQLPKDLWLLEEDLEGGRGKDFHGRIAEQFGQTLISIGDDNALTNAKIKVPEDTIFSGILMGDGEHFDETVDNTWGILGEIERCGSDKCLVRGSDGEVVLNVESVQEDGMPFVMPPEAFGLARKPWWKDVYGWGQD